MIRQYTIPMRRFTWMFLLSILCGYAAFGQKYYVTVDGRSFADKSGTMTVSRANMAEKGKMTVVPDIGKVTKFTMSYLPVRGEYAGPWGNEQAEFSKEEKAVVEQSRVGDKFLFEEIEVQLYSTGERLHPAGIIVQIE